MTYAGKLDHIGVGAYSTLAGGETFLPQIMHQKLTKYLNFTSYLPEKATKFPNSIHDICRKMPEFYIMFDQKIFFREFLSCFCSGEGAGQPLSPVSYACGWAPGPPPAKSVRPPGAAISSAKSI